MFYRRAFDALSGEEWEKWDDDVIITCMHPDYPDLFDKTSAEEFFHYCLKKFDRIRKIDAPEEDSEMTDAQNENDADEEDGGEEKLDVRKKFPKVRYMRDKSDEDEVHHHVTSSDEDEQEETIPMAKLTVKDKKGPF